MLKNFSWMAVFTLCCLSLPLSAQYEGTSPYCHVRGGLIINEISNGPTTGQNNKEYVELLVTPDDQDPFAPVNLEGWILDDNNIAQSGQGNAAGHFILGSCYSQVPPGSLLVIYNPDDRNPDLPPDDPQDSDQDGVYIIPANHDCIDVCNSNPTTEDANYCPCSDPDQPASAWQIGLRNPGDVFQVRDRCETVVHAISWGDAQVSPEVTASPVHIRIGSDSQSGRLIHFTHSAGDDWNTAINYENPGVEGNQTPGAANNAANALFIDRLRTGGLNACNGSIFDCRITDAGDLLPPAGRTDLPIVICQGTDLDAFQAVYDQPDEFRPEAPGFTFEYAFLLSADDAPVFELLSFNSDGDFDFSAWPVGTYRLWGFSYIQTNGSVSLTELLENSISSILDIQTYFACGYDGDLDSLDRNGQVVEIQIIDAPQAFTPEDPLSVCGSGGQGIFALRQYDDIISGNAALPVSWFTDPEGVQPITDPDNYASGSDTVYARVGQEDCFSASVPVILQLSDGPGISIEIEQDINCEQPLGRLRLISASSDITSIDWNVDEWDGSELLTDLPSGQYSVTVTNSQGCRDSASVDLSDNIPINADFSTQRPTCAGAADGTIILEQVSGGLPPYQVSNDGQTFVDAQNWSWSGLTAGTYQITVADATGCELISTVEISDPPPLQLDLGNDQQIEAGAGATVTVNSNFSFENLEWSPDTGVSPTSDPATFVLSPASTTTYVATATDTQGCTAQGSITISIDDTMEPVDSTAIQVYIPNAFSPNGDGVNDIFTIYADDTVVNVSELRIFDRWGNFLYQVSDLPPNDIRQGWRGEAAGQPLDEGVYIYFIEVELQDGRTATYKGSITLLR